MSAPRPHVTVVLPVYNGAAYLEAQIDSILAQDGVTLRLIAVDDGSQDGSAALLRRLSQQHPALEVIANETNFGLMRTLARLLAMVEPSDGYIALADQDDVWDRDKLSASVAALEERGAALVYSDVRVIDAGGAEIAPAYLAPHAIRPVEGRDPLPFVFRNPAIGHTIVTRAALAPDMAKLPSTMTFHEAWLVGVACRTGPVVYLDRRLGGYRQHGSNVIGAKAGAGTRLARLFGRTGTIYRRQQARAAALAALAPLHPRLAPLAALTARHGLARIAAWPGFAAWQIQLASSIGLGAALTEIALFPFGAPPRADAS